jgi:hypothetical protein
MPAAHLLIVLNVNGAARTASASGNGSCSVGSRGYTRTDVPLAISSWSTSTQSAAVGVKITWGRQPRSTARRHTETSCLTGGAAVPMTYNVRARLIAARPLGRPMHAAPAWQIDVPA